MGGERKRDADYLAPLRQAGQSQRLATPDVLNSPPCSEKGKAVQERCGPPPGGRRFFRRFLSIHPSKAHDIEAGFQAAHCSQKASNRLEGRPLCLTLSRNHAIIILNVQDILNTTNTGAWTRDLNAGAGERVGPGEKAMARDSMGAGTGNGETGAGKPGHGTKRWRGIRR